MTEEMSFQVSLENCQGFSIPDEGGKLPLDHLVEIRDRAVCHQHNNVGEAMCLYDGPSDVGNIEKRRGPRIDPRGTPVTSRVGYRNPVPIWHRYLCNRYVLEPNQNAYFGAMPERSVEICPCFSETDVKCIITGTAREIISLKFVVTRVCCFHIPT